MAREVLKAEDLLSFLEQGGVTSTNGVLSFVERKLNEQGSCVLVPGNYRWVDQGHINVVRRVAHPRGLRRDFTIREVLSGELERKGEEAEDKESTREETHNLLILTGSPEGGQAIGFSDHMGNHWSGHSRPSVGWMHREGLLYRRRGYIAPRFPWRDVSGCFRILNVSGDLDQARCEYWVKQLCEAVNEAWVDEPIKTTVEEVVENEDRAVREGALSRIVSSMESQSRIDLVSLSREIVNLRKSLALAESRLEGRGGFHNVKKALKKLEELEGDRVHNVRVTREGSPVFELRGMRVLEGGTRWKLPDAEVQVPFTGGWPTVSLAPHERDEPSEYDDEGSYYRYPHPHIEVSCWGETREITDRNKEILASTFNENVEDYITFLESFLCSYYGEADELGRYHGWSEWCMEDPL